MEGNDVAPHPSCYASLVMHSFKKWKDEADVVCKKLVQLAETELKCSNSDQHVCGNLLSLRASYPAVLLVCSVYVMTIQMQVFIYDV